MSKPFAAATVYFRNPKKVNDVYDRDFDIPKGGVAVIVIDPSKKGWKRRQDVVLGPEEFVLIETKPRPKINTGRKGRG